MKTLIRTLFYSLPLCIVVSLFVQMVVSNEMMVSGTKLQRIDQRIKEVSAENEILSRYVNSLSSISRIEKDARLLGMKEGNSFIAFDTNNFPVALKR